MRIGVITWFKYENSGTALQAVALQTYLRSHGHKAELIDYEMPEPENHHKRASKNLYTYTGLILNKIDRRLRGKTYIAKSNNFTNFIANYCIISEPAKTNAEYINICNSYELLIFGSDQIWNPNWHHPFYFANYDEIKTPRISYAPSFGVSDIDKDDRAKLKKALRRFDNLSVREKAGVEIIKKTIGSTPELVVDPTFLLSKTEWETFIDTKKSSEKYIFCYMLTDNKSHWKAIKEFSRKMRMNLVILPHDGHSLIESKNIMRDAGPKEFLELIHNAEYVITDSYHALIFSLIFDKKYFIFERHNPIFPGAENSRIYNLLDMLDVRNRLINYGTSHINIDSMCKLDYGQYLNDSIKSSKDYLNKAIKEHQK